MKKIRIANELNGENLIRLTRNEIAAIHVEQFYPATMCEKYSEKAIENPNWGYYDKEYVNKVARLYTPYADVHGNPTLEQAYHDQAIGHIRDTRAIFYPHISPMDHVRLLLEEFWPGGVALQKFNGRKCFGGIMRVFAPGEASFHAHYDRIDEETDAAEVKGITQQLGMNIYLQMPKEGGDLQMWLRQPNDEERRHVRQFEGLPHGSIAPPVHTIHPGTGDLIMMSSWLLHAVTPGKDRARISIGSFIGCFGKDQPLTIWS